MKDFLGFCQAKTTDFRKRFQHQQLEFEQNNIYNLQTKQKDTKGTLEAYCSYGFALQIAIV